MSYNGYTCTRQAGHPENWNHIAANTTSVVDVWGAGSDPFGHVVAGDRAANMPGYDNDQHGIRANNRDRWCRATKVGHPSGAFCTRPVSHPGQHISTRGTNAYEVIWVDPVTPPAPPVEFVDPEDGSPADAEDRVFTDAPEIGDVVKLRDRVNRLYVLGKRTHEGEMEVLDLTRNEFRTLLYSRLVRLDDAVLTAEELTQVTRWYSGHRQDVRRVAVREYRAGRWCRDGLNENLRALGLEDHQPILVGQIRVTVPFECPDIHATQSQIEARVAEALGNPEVAAALRLALPPVDGIELQSEQLTITANNFNRS